METAKLLKVPFEDSEGADGETDFEMERSGTRVLRFFSRAAGRAVETVATQSWECSWFSQPNLVVYEGEDSERCAVCVTDGEPVGGQGPPAGFFEGEDY